MQNNFSGQKRTKKRGIESVFLLYGKPCLNFLKFLSQYLGKIEQLIILIITKILTFFQILFA